MYRALPLTLLLMFILVACDGDDDTDVAQDTPTPTTTAEGIEPTSTPAPTPIIETVDPTPSTEPTPESTPTTVVTTGDYIDQVLDAVWLIGWLDQVRFPMLNTLEPGSDEWTIAVEETFQPFIDKNAELQAISPPTEYAVVHDYFLEGYADWAAASERLLVDLHAERIVDINTYEDDGFETGGNLILQAFGYINNLTERDLHAEVDALEFE